MKLIELMETFPDYNSNTIVNGPNITPEQLKLMKSALLECEEFKDVTDLVIVDTPAFLTDEGTTFESVTYQLKRGDYTRFKGKLYLYSISFGSPVIDVHTYQQKEGMVDFTIYEGNSFDPKQRRQILLSCVLSEDAEDAEENEKTRKELHDSVDRILENPEKHQLKKTRSVLLRGKFD